VADQPRQQAARIHAPCEAVAEASEFFAVLGAPPAIGRDFRGGDDLPGADAVAILTNAFWRQRFAADPSSVGRTIWLNSTPTMVIGVLQASFRHPFPPDARQPDLFVPIKARARGAPSLGGKDMRRQMHQSTGRFARTCP
jgi:MacB-like protein